MKTASKLLQHRCILFVSECVFLLLIMNIVSMLKPFVRKCHSKHKHLNSHYNVFTQLKRSHKYDYYFK